MKKSFLTFILALLSFFLLPQSIAAEKPPVLLYDFNEKNSTCYWTTDLSPSQIIGDDWVGTTNKVNNTISLSTASKPVKGSEYPYFVLRVKYEIPDGTTYQPISHAYFKIVDENGGVVADTWQKNGVNKDVTMKSGDNGKYVTYFFDMSGFTLYNENYVSQTTVGIGMYYTGVKVSLDFAAFVPDKNVVVSFEDPSQTAFSLPKPVKAEIGSAFDLLNYSAQKEDNRLIGWSLTPNGTEIISQIDCIKKDTVVYAVWEKAETVKMTYHYGDAQSETAIKNPGDRLYAATTPTRTDGLIFYGWSESPDSREVLPYSSTVTASKEVYAVWGEGYEWNFDIDGDKGNITTDQISNVTVQGGVLRGTTSGKDPKITLRVTAPFGKFNTLVVQGSADSQSGSDGAWYQVFAGLDNNNFAEQRAIVQKLTFADGLTELRYELYNKILTANAYKNITSIRLDPGAVKDVNLSIERIFLIPDVTGAALFDANDGNGHMPRILPDERGVVTLPECTFTHDYKLFEAWSDGEKRYAPGAKVPVNGFVTFYPLWKEGKIKNLDTEFYPGFTKKALIFSYDDGNDPGDRALTSHLNTAGFVGSFNIIPSHWDSLSEAQLESKRRMYAGHEIANHTDTHPNMTNKNAETGEFLYDDSTCINDIAVGKGKLERIFGDEVVGLAWPYTIPASRPTIRRYAMQNYLYVRGSGDNYSFDVPSAFADEWTFTVYQARYKGVLKEYAEKYQAYSSPKLSLFSVWGHSFEFYNGSLTLDEYDEFLGICQTIDLWNPTCADYVRYINAHRQMIVDYENVYNPSPLAQYIKADGEEIILPAGARYDGDTVYCNEAFGGHDGLRVTVNLDTRKASGQSAVLLAAAYDKNGKPLSIETKRVSGGLLQTENLVLPISDGAATVRTFVFDNLTSFAPIDTVKTIPVSAN